jgi:DNA-binding NarL/FixJ family response regulator
MADETATSAGLGASDRVLVVDDHRTFADLLALALDDVDGVQCVGEAHDAAQARLLMEELLPDVVIMDVEIGQDDGVELTAELVDRYPDLRVLILTAHANRGLIQRAADAGACALLPKDGALPSLLQALRWSRRDTFVVDPTLLQTLVTSPREAPTARAVLSEREAVVLGLMAEGVDSRRAAQQLGISIHTFRGHVHNVLVKLDAHSQLEAVAIAKREGLLG